MKIGTKVWKGESGNSYNFTRGMILNGDITGTKIKCNTFNDCFDAINFNSTSPSTLVIECNSGEEANNTFTGSLNSDITNNNSAVTVEWLYPGITQPTTSGVGPINFASSSIPCSTCNSYFRISNPNNLIKRINIHPNPTANFINIHLSELEKADLEVYNVLGKKIVKKQVYDGSNRLELTHFTSGVYFCKLYSNHQLILEEKLIISK